MVDEQVLNPLNIQLDFSNPRFSMFNFNTEEEILNYLINFENIKTLAFQIAENGYNTIGERLILLELDNNVNKKFKVIEGNRRIASIKLIFQYQNLLTTSERNKIEKLNLNIEDFFVNCDVVKENDQANALFKISSKHVEGIKVWRTIDKRVFYYNLYKKYKELGYKSEKCIKLIKEITPERIVDIKKSIKELKFLLLIHNQVKQKFPNLAELTHLDTDVLTSRVFRPLKKELSLSEDQDFNLIAKDKFIFNRILYLLGKSVWIDQKLNTRNFNKQNQWEKIINDDTLISGLREEIYKYKSFDTSNIQSTCEEKNSDNNTGNFKEYPKDLPVVVQKEEPKSNDVTLEKSNEDTTKSKYKLFVKDLQLLIETSGYDLLNNIEIHDEKGNTVNERSSEYKIVAFSSSDDGISIKKSLILPISENGEYKIKVYYKGIIKEFKLVLNIKKETQDLRKDVLFSEKWYLESIAKLSNNSNYDKICSVLRNMKKINDLKLESDILINVNFLTRILLEYSSRAYADKYLIKERDKDLPVLISSIRQQLLNKKIINNTEAKAIKKTDDIQVLNSQIHDYRTFASTIDAKTTCDKYQKYLTVIFEEITKGEYDE